MTKKINEQESYDDKLRVKFLTKAVNVSYIVETFKPVNRV